jgi:predicted lipid-binding transport protein (Tim44 family)
MGDGFQYGDIIFLGLIAVFIALRLRAMLGKSSGVSDAWKQAARDLNAEKAALIPEKPAKKALTEDELIPPQLQSNSLVSDGLKAIRAADPTFSTSEFLSGAKLAFDWMVAAYSKGDKDKLRMLLSPERLQHFSEAIDQRAKTDMKHETTLVAMLATDITEASCKASKAQITVQFTSEQVNVTRDKDNTVVEGDPSAIEKVIDVWTFERDLSSRDPNWKIVHT